ncbi:hypothetical protein WCD74_17870 [Actinomycetospora sp. OC33-EN08]|uniref:Uncharacterized protein n=1 Tax=Actinomycetospora aurantiaca TaxID=3129233 RepID=A0ABU8MRT7_9PSEU
MPVNDAGAAGRDGAGCEPGSDGCTTGRAGGRPVPEVPAGRAGGGGTDGGGCSAVGPEEPRVREPVSSPAPPPRVSGAAAGPNAAAGARKDEDDSAFGKPTGGEGGAGSSAGRGRKISP